MRTLKRVGTIATGALMLGAAISGAVSAGLDDTGMTKGFFYDAGYNPVVQIVVGEKGMATDAVAAGNIAAVIGNLAYTTTTAQVGGGVASGEVVLGISARGATGKYEQATKDVDGTQLIKVDQNSNNRYDFYEPNDGLSMNSSSRGHVTYNLGNFISYSLACNQQERTEAGILKKGTYNNIHCLFCETLCMAALENPEHDMEESISVDYNLLTYFQDGLRSGDAESLKMKADSRALSYTMDAGYVPMSKVLDAGGDEIDFEWRGKFLLFGEEYYTKDIKGTDKIYLAKGRVLDDISSEGYTSEYMGYKFKVDHLIYSQEYTVAGILLDVEKPDGTVVQTQISRMANGIVDDIEIAGVYAQEADAVATASIIVYDTTTNVLLEDGKDMELGGEVKRYWRSSFGTTTVADPNVDVSDYTGAASGDLLSNITVEYRRSITLGVDESLDFPSTYKLIFSGYRTKDYVESACSGAGEGDVVIEKIDRSRAVISFTGDDGQRYDDVHIDQGPFYEGDMFVANGLVYQYDDHGELTSSDTVMQVTLRDMLSGGRTDYNLNAIGSSTDILLRTYAFEEADSNDQYITIEPDTVDTDSDVYIGQFSSGIYILYDGGDIYLVSDYGGTALTAANAPTLLYNNTLGIEQFIFSGGSGTATLSKLEMNDNSLAISVVNENGTFDLNVDRHADADDRLIQIENNDGEFIVIDLYSRNFNESYTYHSQSLLTSGNEIDYTTPQAYTSPGTAAGTDYAFIWQHEEDTVAMLPEGGTTATIDYGGARDIRKVTICQPQDIVYATVFVGTAEQATTLDTTITKADEGTEKTVGCCTYLVKEFGVATTGASAMSAQVNPIVGNLVVSEIAADTTKNLIIVGGPAVNGMSALERSEIEQASGQYVVRKDGNKVYVAGWTAADTIDAGNALIAWLQNNVH